MLNYPTVSLLVKYDQLYLVTSKSGRFDLFSSVETITLHYFIDVAINISHADSSNYN